MFLRCLIPNQFWLVLFEDGNVPVNENQEMKVNKCLMKLAMFDTYCAPTIGPPPVGE
jgi:hypothetical protein